MTDETVTMASQEVELTPVKHFKDEDSKPVLEVNCVVSNTEDKQTEESHSKSEKQMDPEQTEDKNGVNNPVFMQDEGVIEETVPCLTYVDFLPTQTHPELKSSNPFFSSFSALVEQANGWLEQNPEYCLWKCETVTFKVQNDFTIEQDNTLYMESAYGINKYVHGLRLWLVPQFNTKMPVAQIGFTTAIPGRQDENGHVRASANCTIQDSLEQLNKQFQKKPLPGVILNIEMVDFREGEKANNLSIDPNRTFWSENGAENLIRVSAIRIFFILGKTEYVKIGFHDELPEFTQSPFAISMKFGPFSEVVGRMGVWLQDQKGIRVVHLQSINTEVSHGKEGIAHLDTSQCCRIERTGIETRFAKILRAFYVYQKSEEKPYTSVKLHTRLFTPVRKDFKLFESFSKTMQRTIKWMDYTRVPPFSVETVNYQLHMGGDGTPNLEEKVDKTVRRNAGRYQLSNIRIYFPSAFTEPPPEISPEVDTQAGWGCVIS